MLDSTDVLWVRCTSMCSSPDSRSHSVSTPEVCLPGDQLRLQLPIQTQIQIQIQIQLRKKV